MRTLVALPFLAAALAALYLFLALRFSYSSGERSGYVQRFSKRGWVCKTWEGELAAVTLPGAAPEIFRFSVREEAVAARINQSLGQRVTLGWEQHAGLPDCFGESEYFVTGVRRVQP